MTFQQHYRHSWPPCKNATPPARDGIDLIGINAEGEVASLSMHLRPLRAVVALQNCLATASGMPALTLIEECQEMS